MCSKMSNENGQTLMELIVVILISVLVIVALVFGTIASLRNAQFAKNQAQATKLAQEGIERVRVGRDRNQPITISDTPVSSWNGYGSLCTGTTDIKTDSIWCYQINGNCGDSTLASPTFCYFNVDNQGRLTNLTAASFIPSRAEDIPPFHRAIILSDDAVTFASLKTVTAVVRWTDFSGPHESRLTTILRKI